MILNVTAQALSLEDPQDLKSYKVLLNGSATTGGTLIDAHPELRRVDPQHVAIGYETLARLAGALVSDRDWLSNFEGMLEYATSRGWVTEAGEIVGHIEFLP